MSLQEPKCSVRKCVWFNGVVQPDGTEKTERPYCQAFPKGIPYEIAYGEDLHKKVRDDQDNEIVFEKE